MKKKALVMVLVCVMGLSAICIGSADAAQWYTCTISQAGATTWGCFVMLTDTAATPAFQNRLFLLDYTSTYEKSLLASRKPSPCFW
jgi:hypothetical protein